MYEEASKTMISREKAGYITAFQREDEERKSDERGCRDGDTCFRRRNTKIRTFLTHNHRALFFFSALGILALIFPLFYFLWP